MSTGNCYCTWFSMKTYLHYYSLQIIMPINYLYLSSITLNFGIFAFFTSLAIGMVVIVLTLFGVRKIFGTYKYLMVIFTSLSIVLAFTEALFKPNLHFYNSGLVYFALSSTFGLSKKAMNMILAAYAGIYSLTISLLAVQFVYRYWALFGVRYMIFFRGLRSLIWFVYCFVFGFSWCIGSYFLLQMDQDTKDYFQQEMRSGYNVAIEEIPALYVLYFHPGNGSIRWNSIMYTTSVSFIMTMQYGIMVYCGWNMQAKMEQTILNFSPTLKRHHRQLFRTLVFQITCPTIFLFSPLVIIMYLPFFGIECSFPAGGVFSAISVYPIMDSIIVLVVVSEYRVVLKSVWDSLFGNKSLRTIDSKNSVQLTTLKL